MSRPWSESWLLLLGHGGATLHCRRSGLRSATFDEKQLPIAESSTAFGEVCERLLPGLRDALQTRAAGASLRVLVGDMWTRVRVIDGNFRRLTDRQIDLMAEVSLEELLGHSPAKTAYRWQIQRGGRHLFTSALMSEVAERAHQLGADLGLDRVSVSTHFASAWNAAANPMGGRESGVFAVVASHYASVACVSNGVVTGITQGGLSPGVDALDRRVERDLAAWGVDVDAGLKFVLADSETPAADRWQRYDVCKRVSA